MNDLFDGIISIISVTLTYLFVLIGIIPIYLYYLLFDEEQSFRKLLSKEKIKECMVAGFCIGVIVFFVVMYNYNVKQIETVM